MAAIAPGGAPRIQQHDIQTINDDNYQKCVDFIVSRTGIPPVSHQHLYGFKTHLDKYIHPNPNPQNPLNRRNRVTPLGLGLDTIPEQLTGWENISDEQKDTYQQIFNRYTTDEMQTAFDRFFQRQGRRPNVDEFSRYLLTLEGNDHQETSRKTLGNLFIESEELKRVVDDDVKVIESLNTMMASKDVMNNTLSEAYTASLAEIEGLKVDLNNYQAVLKILEGDKRKLEEDKNMLTMDLNFEINQNEDLRGEKIRLDNQNAQLKRGITEVRSELALVENQLKMVDDAVVKFTTLLVDVETKLSEAEGNVESLLNEIGFLKGQLTGMTHDKLKLQQTLDTVTDDNQKLTDDQFRLQQTLDTVTDDKFRLQQTLDTVADDKFRLQQTLDTVTDDNQKLTDDNQKLTDDNQKLTDDNQKLTDDNQKLTDDQFRLQQTLDTVTDDKFRLQQTLDTVTDDKFRLQQTLDTVTDDYSRLESGVTKLEQEKAHLDRQLLFFESIFVIVILGFILTAFNFRSLEQYSSS